MSERETLLRIRELCAHEATLGAMGRGAILWAIFGMAQEGLTGERPAETSAEPARFTVQDELAR